MRLTTQINILNALKNSASGSIPLSKAYLIASEERDNYNIGTNISTHNLRIHVNVLIDELRDQVPLLSIVNSPLRRRIGTLNLTDMSTSLLVYKPYYNIFKHINGYAANMTMAGEDEVVDGLMEDRGNEDSEETVFEFFKKVVETVETANA